MSETTENAKDTAQPEQQGAPIDPQLPLALQAQYIKDMSLESPHMPGTVPAAALQKDVGFFMDARKLEEESEASKDADFYEVALGVNLKAQHEDKTVYVLELLYGVRCAVHKDVPDNQRHPMLLIEVPRYAFPFVRQLVADMTQNAGYPPFYMAPVDFAKLYVQRFSAQKKGAEAGSEGQDEAGSATA